MSKVTAAHAYQTAQPDDGDPDKVSANEWNAQHALSGVIYENDQTISADYTIPANKNAVSAGPITIADTFTVTVSTGAEWVIL
jgi:hypothetical protein